MAEAFGVDLNARTNVETETGSYATTAENIFTAGDHAPGAVPGGMGDSRRP